MDRIFNYLFILLLPTIYILPQFGISPVLLLLLALLVISLSNFTTYFFQAINKIYWVYFFTIILSQSLNSNPLNTTFIYGVLIIVVSLAIASYIIRNPLYRLPNMMWYYCLSIVIMDIWILANNGLPNFGTRLSLPYFSVSLIAYNNMILLNSAVFLFENKSKMVRIFFIVLSIFAILGALSKNAMIAFVIIIAIDSILMSKSKYGKSIIFFSIITVFLCYMLFIERIEYLFSFIENDMSGKDGFSVSGRTLIWEECINIYNKYPIFGCGYENAMNLLHAQTYNGAVQAHNAFYNSLVTVGTVGTFALFYYFLSSLFKAFYLVLKNKTMFNVFLLNIIIYFLIRGFTESSFAQCGGIDNLLFIIVTITSSYIYKRIKFKK